MTTTLRHLRQCRCISTRPCHVQSLTDRKCHPLQPLRCPRESTRIHTSAPGLIPVAVRYRQACEIANEVDNLTPAELQAGGYRLDWTLKRAMQEAFASLFELD